MANFLLFINMVFLLLPFSGCIQTTSSLWIAKNSLSPPPPGSEEIIRLSDGEKVSFQKLSDALQGARVIFMGESHDQIEHHQIQVRILKDLLARGRDVVIGMEMFERSQQPILDRWSQGRLKEEEFLTEIDWEKTWAMDYQLYRAILEEAKAHRIKVVGLNVQRDLVRKVARKGIENLSPEERANLPEIDLTDREHLSYIKALYREHQGGVAETFEHFYQAQCLWDEGMAETLSQFLKSPEAREKTVVVIAGSGHIVFDFGIPKRFYRRTPLPYQTIVLKTWEKNLKETLAFSGASKPIADYLWITHPTPLEKKRPKIGVALKEKDDPSEVWIEQTFPGSPAEKAGLLPGDRILSVDGKEIKRLRDLHDAMVRKGSDKEILITLLREGVGVIIIRLTF
jgi:uncharacterized iron-regulated protein